MLVATWNLERGGCARAARAAQEDALRELAADVIVLTEPPAQSRSAAGVVASSPRREDAGERESWVAIVGACVEPVALDVPYDRMAVAARARVGGEAVVVYGAVLPWLAVAKHAPDVVRSGEDSEATFLRALDEQVEDVRLLQRMHPGEMVIWAGDFNQTLAGPLWGGSRTRRDRLASALASIGYAAWNAHAAHAMAGMNAIDLICGPAERAPVRQGRVDCTRGGVVMSDHAGYWVETA